MSSHFNFGFRTNLLLKNKNARNPNWLKLITFTALGKSMVDPISKVTSVCRQNIHLMWFTYFYKIHIVRYDDLLEDSRTTNIHDMVPGIRNIMGDMNAIKKFLVAML